MRKVVVELDEDDYVFLNDVSLILNLSISEVIKLTIHWFLKTLEITKSKKEQK